MMGGSKDFVTIGVQQVRSVNAEIASINGKLRHQLETLRRFLQNTCRFAHRRPGQLRSIFPPDYSAVPTTSSRPQDAS
jgi:hypothetical protein